MTLFNAINHGLLAYRYGDSPIIRGMLQGKEYLQQGQEYLRGRDPRTQYIDRMNNLVGYDLVGLSGGRGATGNVKQDSGHQKNNASGWRRRADTGQAFLSQSAGLLMAISMAELAKQAANG